MAKHRRDSGSPVAWADESQNPQRTLYVLSAAVYTSDQAAQEQARRLESAAATFGVSHVHANEAADDELAAYEKIIATDPELVQITTVQAPIGAAGGMEHARQRCLAEMAAQLTVRGVRRLTLDTRDDLHHGARSGEVSQNARDRETIAALKADVAIVPRNFKLVHADDADDHRLWIPDVIAYASYRALDRDDPDRLALLATKSMHIYPAEHLPVAQRRTGDVERNRELGLALARVRTAAQLAGGKLARDEAYRDASFDDARELGLDAAVDRIRTAEEASQRVESTITRYEHSHPSVRTIAEIAASQPGWMKTVRAQSASGTGAVPESAATPLPDEAEDARSKGRTAELD